MSSHKGIFYILNRQCAAGEKGMQANREFTQRFQTVVRKAAHANTPHWLTGIWQQQSQQAMHNGTKL